MIARPGFFESIRLRAAQRWDQLESDPELAGPWHLLFKQVQSPRHVLSELLQNADDAGATEAIVEIRDQEFIFAHNGEDFTETHFASLCRFGYSNKRALHTIGFRGVGFKSTFSLGNEVRLFTPSLSVAFYRKRFTEPVWVNGKGFFTGWTEIRVLIQDQYVLHELEKNLRDWMQSPVSLLFFSCIRRLRIGDHPLHWVSGGPGPPDNSEWLALASSPEKRYLLLRSAPQDFPYEALDEIRQERMLSPGEETDFPPCRVELVLGSDGRLFVVLPTGVKTTLPFACNAPFVQDPARLKIKDPETSPTNRWLLERVGELAATGMLAWLELSASDRMHRAEAYKLFPDVDRDDNSLEGSCATIVEEAFEKAIQDKPCLLTDDGTLVPCQEAIIYPQKLLEVWSAEQISALFDTRHRQALCRDVSEDDRKKLLNWGLVEHCQKSNIMNVLMSAHPPKPKAWPQLLKLWTYVSGDITSYHNHTYKGVRILPAQGRDVLYSSSDVVRMGERKLLASEEDWEFLARYLLVLNQNWPRFLATQRREAEELDNESLAEEVEAAYKVLGRLGLADASDVSRLIDHVSAGFFAQPSCSLLECVHLAQIAATLGATVGKAFRFVTRDSRLCAPDEHLVFDANGTIESHSPTAWQQEHILHKAYHQSFHACSRQDWDQWIASGRSGLLTAFPLTQERASLWSQRDLREELQRRGHQGNFRVPYVTSRFFIDDWDFEESLWQHWESLAAADPDLWGNLLTRILNQPSHYWIKAITAKAGQVATTGATRIVTSEDLLPGWIVRFRRLNCLQNTRGFFLQPPELLRRTPETELLLDVEPFVHGKLDTEANRPLLIKLGVRDTPTGPDRILDCLRALAQADAPPVYEVEKWYRRLDRMLDSSPTEDFQKVKQAFSSEKIIFTEEHGWVKSSEVFIAADDEDAPGAAVVLTSVRDLMLWRKVDVADRPSADLAIRWLKNLQSGKRLSQGEARRIRSLLSRHPERIWNECGHWLDLEGEWAPLERLVYAVSMQSLVSWNNLFPRNRQRTADFRQLPAHISGVPPFSGFPTLASRIENRFHEQPHGLGEGQSKPWLIGLGAGLQRVVFDDADEVLRIRALAERLEATTWKQAPALETIPYIDGVPAGTPRRVDVLWKEAVLYVEDRPMAKLAKSVAHELGGVFGRQDVTDALKLCFERSPDFVAEYLEENFRLAPPESIRAPKPEDIPRPEEQPLVPGAGVPSQAEESPSSTPLDSEGPVPPSPAEVEPAEEEGDNWGENVADENPDEAGEEEPARHDKPIPKPPKPRMIERFARSRGYQKDSSDRFFHPDGSWIGKTNGNAFPWERRSASGEVLQYYWSKDHCLEQEPLQLEADVWGLCDKFPGRYTLLLTDIDGSPREIPGHHLRQMCTDGKLTLHPATYRLVYENSK